MVDFDGGWLGLSRADVALGKVLGVLMRSCNISRIKSLLILIFIYLFCMDDVWSRQIFFTSSKPTVSVLDDAKKAAWLASGQGDDGYLKIEVTTSMKNGCIPLGNAGILKIIAKEEIQLAVSIRLKNISSSFQGREIPIAVLDGRSNPGGCLPLTIIDGGMTLVPLARLEPAVASKDTPRFELFVRSTSSSNVNLVGPSLAVLGVATVFATGGAASTVTSLTSALAQPAFKQLEGAWDFANSGLTPSVSGDSYSWESLRSIERIEFPIFSDIASYSESDAVAIPRLQNDNISRKSEFKIELRLSHYPTAFEVKTYGAKGLPVGSDVSPVSVFNYPNQAGIPTVAQLFEQEISALSKANDENSLKDACNIFLTKANNAGFALKDRAISLYLAMNKVRAPGWRSYEFDSCMHDQVQVDKIIREIWGGEPPIVFQYADARKRSGDKDEQYTVWSEIGVPFLDLFRKAVTDPRVDERERLLKKLTAGADLKLDASTGSDEWPNLPTGETAAPLPQLQRLAAKGLVSAGCFTYRPGNEFKPNTNPGDLLLLDEKERIWVASPRRSSVEIFKLAEVEIFAIDENWRRHYESLFAGKYYGNPVQGGCAKIQAVLLKKP